jgi:signal peptidase I
LASPELAGILVTAVAWLLVKTILIRVFFLPSRAMEPTLHGRPGCMGDRTLSTS